MAIARAARPVPGRDRQPRWLTAIILATLTLGAAVVPVLAGDPSPSPAPSPVAPAEAGAAVDPSASPAPSPSPDPSASPTPAPTATVAPTPTPVPTPTPTPWPLPSWPTSVTTLGSSVTFYGLGYGHGVGLNQYGAKGRAAAGQTAEQILPAYFKGATFAKTTPTRLIRILVLDGYTAPSSAPAEVVGLAGPWCLSTSSSPCAEGSPLIFPAKAKLRAWRTTTTVDGVATTIWRVQVKDAVSGAVLYYAARSGSVYVVPQEPTGFVQVLSRTSSYDTYRGSIRLILGTSSLRAVNHVGLDDYLRGVVPVEMPSTWPREALRAQAIAARSYAYKGLNPGTGVYDVYDDTRAQLYRGVEAEKAATDEVIAADPGKVIKYGDSVIKAFFFSTGGGWTENNEYVFVGSSGTPGTSKLPYLRGIKDRNAYGVPYDATAPYFDWKTSAISRTTLSTMLGKDSRTKVGTLTKLDLRRRGVSGRLYQVVLYGTSGTKTVSADVFRSVYNAYRPSGTAMLRSNLFDTKPIPLP